MTETKAEPLDGRARLLPRPWAALSPATVEWAGAIVLTALLGAYTHHLMAPQVGFDDANITQAYARAIAAGHGYVYNVGGEWVEGSTSLLWTLVNAAFFLATPRPEPLLAGLSALITAATLAAAFALARSLGTAAGHGGVAFPAMAAVAAFPGFFTWSVWSLMDTGLWVLLIVSAAGAAARLVLARQPTRADRALLVGCSLLLPLCRPEGVAFAVGLDLGLLVLAGLLLGRRCAGAAALALGAAVAAFVAATAWRLATFGYPLPNTVYAKVSSSLTDQAGMGYGYLRSYLDEPANLVLLVGGALGSVVAISAARGTGDRKSVLAVLILLWALVTGGLALYAALGGDHFGGHRFYLFVLPLLLAPASLAVRAAAAGLRRILPARMGAVAPAALALAVAAAALVPLADYARTFGNVAKEFRIAEDGREIGRRLRSFPGRPTVGVIPAGGIRMGYDGEMRDLLGLNWVAMAQAEHRVAGKLKNHGGFNTAVFFAEPPMIVHPLLRSCDEAAVRTNGWVNQFLDDLFARPEFNALYTFRCRSGLTFFARKDYAAVLDAHPPP